MLLRQIILEKEGFDANELLAFKDVIASKIKQLPQDDATAKTLKEIEELLTHVNAGGRMGMINGALHSINDPAVLSSQKRLSQYLASMEVSPDERKELFHLWKTDKILNIDVLLSKKNVTFSELFNGYDTNKAIKELVDDVMEVADLGQGKGEFGLNVLSKSVSKPGSHTNLDQDGDDKAKGDLIIKYNGKWRKIEVKTTQGGGARFADQEVRPAEGYEAASSELNASVEKLKSSLVYKEVFPNGMAKGYGMNLGQAINWYRHTQLPKVKADFLNKVDNVVTLIFGGKKADHAKVSAIIKAIKSGDDNTAKQQWAQACFNYYIGQKDDEGVLAINLNSKSIMFYSTSDDLTKQGLRFSADTIYLTAKDAQRGAYPQISVIPTTFGANAKAAGEKKAADAEKSRLRGLTRAATANPVDAPARHPTVTRAQFNKDMLAFATNFAHRKKIYDPGRIKELSVFAADLIASGASMTSIRKQLSGHAAEMLPS